MFLLSRSKNILCNIRKSYRLKLDKIHKYLDDELSYLDSQFYYTNQKKLKKLKMEYEAYSFENEIQSIGSLPEPAIEEIIRTNKKITENTWGVILESDKVDDLNVYIAQMNKVQINIRRANFFVVTDSQDLLLELHNIFNWMGRENYIIPNTFNSEIELEFRSSINYHTLKHIDKHISTPNSKFMNLLKQMGGRQVTVPNPKRVFCFNCKKLVPSQ